jgi:hypothetical protein
MIEEALLERTEVGRALLRRVPVLGYAEARCLVLIVLYLNWGLVGAV